MTLEQDNIGGSSGLDSTRETVLTLGNKAAVVGLRKANVRLVTAYPGTPSTEIQMELYRLYLKNQLHFEFSVNEKVALEIASASVMSGLRSAVVLKHVGLNVASDAMMAMAYFGAPAGFVIIVVDDPGCQSSQNEQDSRFWGRFAHIPILEPSTGQEIVDQIVLAFELSERYNQLVLVRLTNFTALNTTEVEEFSEESEICLEGDFFKDVFYALPARYILHKRLHDKIERFGKDEEFVQLNVHVPAPDASSKLVVTHGSIYPIVKYLNEHHGSQLGLLKISAIYPLNDAHIADILKNYTHIYVVEELESYIEREIQAVVGRFNLPAKVIGKEDLGIPHENKITPDVLAKPFDRILANPNDPTTFQLEPERQLPFPPIFESGEIMVPRTLPRLCDGCPHRGAFYSIKKATDFDDIIPSDIGCYALGQIPPVTVGDFWLCMGASIGTAIGFGLTNKKPVVAIIGDGTFFHAGIPPLLDAVMYKHNVTIAILDNYLTAMTGGQPSPASPPEIAPNQHKIDIEQVVRGCGVEWVRSVPVEEAKDNIKVFKEAMAFDGPSVVIFQGDCVIDLFRSQKIFTREYQTAYIDDTLCNDCETCLIDLACPSIVKSDGKVIIREDTCIACGICVGLCPTKAIKYK